jgi:hypothetical protein
MITHIGYQQMNQCQQLWHHFHQVKYQVIEVVVLFVNHQHLYLLFIVNPNVYQHVLRDMIFYGRVIVLYLHQLMVAVVINKVYNHLVHVLKNIMIDHIFIAKIIHIAIIIQT